VGAELADKADLTALQKKADTQTVDVALARKANETYVTELDGKVREVDTALASKANLSSMDSQFEAESAEIASKANASSVSQEFATVGAELADKADLTALQKKADTQTVDAALATKANETYVNAKLATKVSAQDLFDSHNCYWSALSTAQFAGLGNAVLCRTGYYVKGYQTCYDCDALTGDGRVLCCQGVDS